ncbi:MAG: hypothetical protein KUG82_21630 [Pseudomonadales bacterium]|nr:hypothetical protein [Pseudomonadales bacterium]
MRYSIQSLSFALCLSVLMTSCAQIEKLTDVRKSAPVTSFNESVASLLIAQGHLNRAFGLKEQAAISKTDYDALTAGEIDKDQMKTIIKRAKHNDQLLAKKMDETKSLNHEGKTHYKKAIVPFALGVYKMVGLKKDYENYNKSQNSSSASTPIWAKAKDVLRDLRVARMAIEIGEELPSFANSLYGTSSKMITFANKQEIVVPKEATDYLDQL